MPRVCTWPVCIVCLVSFVRYRRCQELHGIENPRLLRFYLIVTSLCERKFKVYGIFCDQWKGNANPSGNVHERATKSNIDISHTSWQPLTDVLTQLPRHLTQRVCIVFDIFAVADCDVGQVTEASRIVSRAPRQLLVTRSPRGCCSPAHRARASGCQKGLHSANKPPSNSTALSFTTASRLVKGPFSGLQSNTSGSCSKRRPVDNAGLLKHLRPGWTDMPS